MKKIVLVILIISLILSSIGVYADGDIKEGQTDNNSLQGVLDVFKQGINTLTEMLIKRFPDLSNHWALEYIANLTNKGAINGYTDGTFKPNGSITRAEFTKIMITSLGSDPGNSSVGHWATNYLSEAIENGYIKEKEFENVNKAITRAEIARMISRAMDEEPQNIDELKKQITDYNQIVAEYKNHVAKVYAAGIIQGYPDGSFKSNGTATRAEASAMLVRFLEPDKRKLPELMPVDKDFIEPEFSVFYPEKDWIDAYYYYNIQLKNKEDYRGHDEYSIKIEVTSHPSINKRDWYYKDGKLNKSNVDEIKTIKGEEIYRYSELYELYKLSAWKTAVT